MKKVFSSEILLPLLLAVLVLPLVFGHLDSLPLRIWDESRLAMNAFEMYHNKNFAVTYFEGAPDMWNTKPPLLIWLQVLSMKVIGINEVGFRFPSALAVFLSCVLIYVFACRFLRCRMFGFIQVSVLVSSVGLFTWHAGKSGDYDALLMFFMSAYALSYFVFIENKQRKYLYFFYLFFTFAVLTKSSAAFFFLPGLLAYTLFRKEFLTLLKNKDVYLGLLIPLVLVGGYYITREILNPGYVRAVFENEFGGRLLQVVEGHQESSWFYVKGLWDSRFAPYFPMAICGAFIGFFNKDRKIYLFTVFASFMLIFQLLIISFAQTKIFWYDLPLYPFLSALTAVFIHAIYEFLSRASWRNSVSNIILPWVFLVCLFWKPYTENFNLGFRPKENNDWDKDYYAKTYYLRELLGKDMENRSYVVLSDAYQPHNLFYIKLLRRQGKNIQIKTLGNIQTGDIVLCDLPESADYIEARFFYTVQETDGHLKVYEISDKK